MFALITWVAWTRRSWAPEFSCNVTDSQVGTRKYHWSADIKLAAFLESGRLVSRQQPCVGSGSLVDESSEKGFPSGFSSRIVFASSPWMKVEATSAARRRRPAEFRSFGVPEEGVWSMQARWESKRVVLFFNASKKVCVFFPQTTFDSPALHLSVMEEE